MLYEQQLTHRDINMRRMHGNFANICASSPMSPVSAPNTSPGRILAFSRHRYTTLPFLLPAAQWNYCWRRLPVKFYLQHVRNDIGPCASSGAQKLIARPLFPARAVDRCDVHELQGPTPAQSSPPVKRFYIQTTRSNISRDQYTGLPLAKRTRV